jgi:hypothetical protein
MIWMYLGIVFAILGFIGVLVCAKLAKSNPNIQPLAIACAIVMLIGIGAYGYVYWNKSEFEAVAAAAKQAVFDKAVLNKIGTELKGKKIHWITNNDANDENFKAKVEFLKAATGAEVVVISTAMSPDGNVTPVDFKKELPKIAETDVILVDTEEVGDAIKSAKKQKFAFTANGIGALRNFKEKEQQNLFKKGQILFIVINKPVTDENKDYDPDEDNLDEAFNTRYELLKEYNKEKLGELTM